MALASEGGILLDIKMFPSPVAAERKTRPSTCVASRPAIDEKIWRRDRRRAARRPKTSKQTDAIYDRKLQIALNSKKEKGKRLFANARLFINYKL